MPIGFAVLQHGFVEMASAQVAQAAISALNGMSVDGRAIVVNLARPREATGGAGAYSAAAMVRPSGGTLAMARVAMAAVVTEPGDLHENRL